MLSICHEHIAWLVGSSFASLGALLAALQAPATEAAPPALALADTADNGDNKLLSSPTAVDPAYSAGSAGLSQLKEPVSGQAGPGPSQREEELEERLRAVERQLAARDAEVATLAQQLGNGSVFLLWADRP